VAFRYPFQSLLRLRESLERQEERRLLATAAVVAKLKAEIEQVQWNALEARRNALQDLAEGGPGAVLQFAVACETAAQRTRKRLEVQLEEAERKRLAQLKNYQAARQKRQILEGLRDRQEAAYQLELSRRAQQTADEAFLIRVYADSKE
jgi:flagellar export protein FliJ